MTTKEIGDRGEAVAKAYLEEKGFTILESNYRYQKSEVDLVVETENFIVFVEVKTRAISRLIEPEFSVDLKKQQLLISAAQKYMETQDKEARFDIISVLYSDKDFQVKHIEEAFYPRFV